MYTLGLEEELFIINPKDYSLVALSSTSLLTCCNENLEGLIKNEFYDCQIEINTPICPNIKNLKSSLYLIHEALFENGIKRDVTFLSTSTHPNESWKNQLHTSNDRYIILEENLKFAVNRLLICSLQFHVGIPGIDLRFPIINYLRQFMPHLLALSTSSPFWEGGNSGFMSYRTPVSENLPRSNVPPFFNSMIDFDQYINMLVKTNTIIDGKEIWWDLRPHPFFPTIEFRVCDNPNDAEDSIALAALAQALVVKIHKLIKNGITPQQEHFLIVQENKWRAARYGLNGKFIDGIHEAEINIKEAICQMLEWVDDIVGELDSRDEIMHIYKIMDRGTSAVQQLNSYEKTGSFELVIKDLLNNKQNSICK
ncbi:MAG: carboxylate-amine ligase [bacterium]|nr:carboxylate-amine ligase [bacterium]